MYNNTVSIDTGRGVAVVLGEEIPLARRFLKGDGWKWCIYADKLRENVKYDVIGVNSRGEVAGVFFGYYRPSMLAIDVYPVWAPPGIRYRRTKVAERVFEMRGASKK